MKGKALGRKRLAEVASIVTPNTILRWYRKLVAAEYDGSKKRRAGGRRTKPAPRPLWRVLSEIIRGATAATCARLARGDDSCPNDLRGARHRGP